MTSTSFIDLLAELQVGISHSRPRVSNDNAYSEAHLKTQPDYPGRFHQHAPERAGHAGGTHRNPRNPQHTGNQRGI